MEKSQLLELVRDFSQRKHRDTMSMADVAMHYQQGQQMLHNGRRMNAQVDMHLRERCGDNYQPPEEDVGNHLFNNVFVGNEALRELSELLDERSSSQEGQAASQPQSPQSAPEPPPAQKPQPVSTGQRPSKKAGLVKTAALVGATALGTGAAVNYFTDDTDTRNVYDIEALPFDPSKPIE